MYEYEPDFEEYKTLYYVSIDTEIAEGTIELEDDLMALINEYNLEQKTLAEVDWTISYEDLLEAVEEKLGKIEE
jgi:hypothetical protein